MITSVQSAPRTRPLSTGADLSAHFLFGGSPSRHVLTDVTHLCHRGSFVPAAKVFGEFRRSQEHLLKHEARAAEKLGCATLIARLSADAERLKRSLEATWNKICAGDRRGFDDSIDELTKAQSAYDACRAELSAAVRQDEHQ